MLKIRKASLALLFEAYRRNDIADSHESTKPLGMRWLGLGSAAAYREALEDGLMTWAASVPEKRHMGWLRLTPKGEEVYLLHAAEFADALARLKRDADYSRSYTSHYQLAGGLM